MRGDMARCHYASFDLRCRTDDRLVPAPNFPPYEFFDEQRESVYTKKLGNALVKAYRRDTIYLSTHLVCRAIFDEL